MRMSQLFTQTLREAPAGVELPGQIYLLRAGYAQPLAAGLSAALPLARRAVQRLERAARRMPALQTAQEIDLPLVLPGELSPQGSTLRDETGRSLSLGGDPLPALAETLRSHLRSYRQLPAHLLQSGPFWQDDPHPQGGWLRGRYEQALTVFSLAASPALLDDTAAQLETEIQTLFQGWGLAARLVESLGGPLSKRASRWFYPLPAGEDAVLACPACGYAAEAGAAQFTRPIPQTEEVLPLEKVATPHCPTIDSLAQFLGVPASRTAKAVFLIAELPGPQNTTHPELLFALVRGDRDLSEARLAHLTGARSLRPATDAEISAIGAVPGYASPVGLKGAWVIVDSEIPGSPNLVSGANEDGFHLLHLNYGRDFTARMVAEIAAARPGDACPHCGAALQRETGVFVGSTETLNALPGCTYRADNGENLPLPVQVTRLHLYRILACLAEGHHDEHGLVWPAAAAPFDLHLVLLSSKTGQTETQAAALYTQLQAAGWEVLFDDRTESPGVKFNDADLIGLPLRLTLSERSLRQGGVEMKLRAGGEAWVTPLEEVLTRVSEILSNP